MSNSDTVRRARAFLQRAANPRAHISRATSPRSGLSTPFLRKPRLDRLATGRSVAIVESRTATEYGKHHAGRVRLHTGLPERRGVGQCRLPHRRDRTLRALVTDPQAGTVAVLACEIDGGYPAGQVGILQRIPAPGAVVSEYAPGVSPARHRLLQRHRLLRRVTTATVAVEAGRHKHRPPHRTPCRQARPSIPPCQVCCPRRHPPGAISSSKTAPPAWSPAPTTLSRRSRKAKRRTQRPTGRERLTAASAHPDGARTRR